MGTKFRYLIIILFFIFARLSGQIDLNFQMADSVTYRYYMSGMWDELIELGERAVEEGIDYKYLRQRLGYAYFMKGDYVRAGINFEKALKSDTFDQFTLAYLSYTNSKMMESAKSGYFASRLSKDSRNTYQIKTTRIIEDFDFELGTKFPSTSLRSNPHYYRLGLGSRPFARLKIYQSVSAFNQYLTIRYPTQYSEFKNRQFEYYGSAAYALLANWSVKAAYHFLYSDYSSSVTYTNQGYFGLSANYNILNVTAEGSFLQNSLTTVRQAGLRAGLRFPGYAGITLTSGIAMLNVEDENNLVFNESVYFRLNAKTWMEGEVAWGNMDYYNDYDGLYVYNSIDPLSFRARLTTYYLAGSRSTIWFSLGGEEKKFYESDIYKYNQFSLLGGVKWQF
jgi:hypothetical protein